MPKDLEIHLLCLKEMHENPVSACAGMKDGYFSLISPKMTYDPPRPEIIALFIKKRPISNEFRNSRKADGF
jgi:hypothetical protein